MTVAPGTRTETMTAITRTSYGGPEVLQLSTTARPAIADDEVLIRVSSAGLDRGVAHLLRGTPYLIRLAFGLRRPRKQGVGLDVSGTVVEVGSRVTRFRVGDEVFGIAKGSYAEYAAARDSKLVLKPAALSHEAAAVVAISGLTALQAVRDVAAIEPGQHVAVIGASGGVGSFAVQIAKANGATVTGVASGSKLEFVRGLGGDHVIDYQSGELDQVSDRFDVILFVAGDLTLRDLRRMMTSRGTLVVIGGEDGGKWIGVGRQLRALLLNPFVGQSLKGLVSKETHTDLEVLGQMIEDGLVAPAVGAVYALEDTGQAVRDLEERRVRGKVAISVRS